MANEKDSGQAGSGATPGKDSSKSENKSEKVPAIDFATFLLSLSTTGLYQMGLVPDPFTGEKATPNLPLAEQTIETLEMLRAKTRGNLDPDEDQLFASLLYELRVRYVELTK